MPATHIPLAAPGHHAAGAADEARSIPAPPRQRLPSRPPPPCLPLPLLWSLPPQLSQRGLLAWTLLTSWRPSAIGSIRFSTRPDPCKVSSPLPSEKAYKLIAANQTTSSANVAGSSSSSGLECSSTAPAGTPKSRPPNSGVVRPASRPAAGSSSSKRQPNPPHYRPSRPPRPQVRPRMLNPAPQHGARGQLR